MLLILINCLINSIFLFVLQLKYKNTKKIRKKIRRNDYALYLSISCHSFFLSSGAFFYKNDFLTFELSVYFNRLLFFLLPVTIGDGLFVATFTFYHIFRCYDLFRKYKWLVLQICSFVNKIQFYFLEIHKFFKFFFIFDHNPFNQLI